ncbi:MAG TPA: energy transducer TonB [Gemmatimonadales bacterium]|nr:energy transducer TonB [Gemmatimonadales bacterium]
MNRALSLVLVAVALVGCRKPSATTLSLPTDAPVSKGLEPPVMTTPDPGVEYPSALFDQGIEGNVVLRLFADTAGRLVPESTRVAESSGYPALDSAALAAVPRFTFAPGRNNGSPVATLFLQPIHFRHPPRGGTTP